MKIALIGPIFPYRGGIAHYTARLAQTLAKSHEVKVFSFKRLYPAWLYPGRSDKDPSQKAVNVGAAYSIDSLNPLSWLQTAKEIRHYRPDIVLIEWWVTFLAPAFTTIAFLCRQSKITVAFLIHNVLPHEGSWFHRLLAWSTLKQGSRFIVHSSNEHERLLALIPYAKAAVCPFPVYDMFEPVSLTQSEARRMTNIPEGGHVVLFFGIVRPYKGLTILIEAMARLREKVPGLYLVVAGEFWEDMKSYQKKIEALALTEQVRLENRYIPDEEVGILFRAADLAVAPYVGGTQSAVSSLAIRFGTPLLVTEWSAAGLDDIHKKRVRVIPSGDALCLAEAIQTFFESKSLPSRNTDGPESSGWETVVSTVERIIK